MGKAGGIVAIIAGVLGILAGFSTLFLGGLGSAFDAKGAGTIVGFGWAGIAASMLVVLSGGIALAKTRVGGMAIIVFSIGGAVLGGTLVAICLALALLGGILAVLAKLPNSDSSLAAASESALRRVGITLGSIVVGIVLAVIGTSVIKPSEASNKPDEANAVPTTAIEMAQVGQVVTGKQFAVTLHSFRFTDRVGSGIGKEQAEPGTVFAVLDISVKCVDSESRWYSPGDLFASIGGRELKFDKQETILGVSKLFGAINPLTEQRGLVVFKLPQEAMDGEVSWNPGRGLGTIRFALNPPKAVVPAPAGASVPETKPGVRNYKSGNSTLEISMQADGRVGFELFAVAASGATGEAKGVIKPDNGVAVWKDADADCELTFRWQGNVIRVEQAGLCGFGWGVEATGEYR